MKTERSNYYICFLMVVLLGCVSCSGSGLFGTGDILNGMSEDASQTQEDLGSDVNVSDAIEADSAPVATLPIPSNDQTVDTSYLIVSTQDAENTASIQISASDNNANLVIGVAATTNLSDNKPIKNKIIVAKNYLKSIYQKTKEMLFNTAIAEDEILCEEYEGITCFELDETGQLVPPRALQLSEGTTSVKIAVYDPETDTFGKWVEEPVNKRFNFTHNIPASNESVSSYGTSEDLFFANTVGDVTRLKYKDDKEGLVVMSGNIDQGYQMARFKPFLSAEDSGQDPKGEPIKAFKYVPDVERFVFLQSNVIYITAFDHKKSQFTSMQDTQDTCSVTNNCEPSQVEPLISDAGSLLYFSQRASKLFKKKGEIIRIPLGEQESRDPLMGTFDEITVIDSKSPLHRDEEGNWLFFYSFDSFEPLGTNKVASIVSVIKVSPEIGQQILFTINVLEKMGDFEVNLEEIVMGTKEEGALKTAINEAAYRIKDHFGVELFDPAELDLSTKTFRAMTENLLIANKSFELERYLAISSRGPENVKEEAVYQELVEKAAQSEDLCKPLIDTTLPPPNSSSLIYSLADLGLGKNIDQMALLHAQCNAHPRNFGYLSFLSDSILYFAKYNLLSVEEPTIEVVDSIVLGENTKSFVVDKKGEKIFALERADRELGVEDTPPMSGMLEPQFYK